MIMLMLVAVARGLTCSPGYFLWVSPDGLEHCAICVAGCACPGGLVACHGCSGNAFTATAGAASCETCPMGTTSDLLLNAGCDPLSFTTPCSNNKGPLGQTSCRPTPPATNVSFTATNGALEVPPQYLTSQPPYVPNEVPPFYDMDLEPMVMQSY